MTKISVLLADDHKMVRAGLTMLVNAQPDMAVIGEADSGRLALILVQQLHPAVVVMDISMPDVNGLTATEELRETCSNLKILILTRHKDNGYLQQMLRAGANGYLLKQSASDELLRAIRQVAAGDMYLDPAVTEAVVSNAIRSSSDHNVFSQKPLTQREEDVLRLIAQGHLSKEVAARLQISIKTAEAHKANAMQKMGMKSRIDIVRYALLRGWLNDT